MALGMFRHETGLDVSKNIADHFDGGPKSILTEQLF